MLGFPAGIIASGAVAAVGAIKGIADATEQINMDHIFDGVLAKGDLTIQQVKDWYNEVTFTVMNILTSGRMLREILPRIEVI